MDSTLAVGLLVVGFVSAFAAIGGKTWRDDQTIPWSRRITARGWIAITCMSLTLGTGILKHVRDRAGIAEARQRAVQSEAKVAEQTRKISDQGTKLEQLAGELRSERQKREAAEKADDDVFAIARKNIE